MNPAKTVREHRCECTHHAISGDTEAWLGLQGKNPENRKRPSVLALSRQNLPNLPGTSIEGVAKGAYAVVEGEGTPDVIVIATGAPATPTGMTNCAQQGTGPSH